LSGRTYKSKQEKPMQAGNSSTRVIAVVGGGTMGADIAASFVASGWRAEIVNPRDAMGESLSARFHAATQKLGARPDLDFARHERLETVPWKEVDLVIEATPERLDVKQDVFKELERLASA